MERSIDDILQLMQSGYEVATEAEDITGDVIDQGQQLANDSGVDGSDGNNGEISTDVDDLLGTKNPENDNTGDDNSGDDGGEGDGSDLPDEPPEENSEGNDNEDMLSGESSEEDNKNNEFEQSRKIKIWKELREFYDTLSDSLDLISKYMPDLSDSATIKSMGNIKENLSEAKSLVMRTLVDDYKSLSYPKLQQRQVGLNHIYELCIKELEVYFDKYRQQA